MEFKPLKIKAFFLQRAPKVRCKTFACLRALTQSLFALTVLYTPLANAAEDVWEVMRQEFRLNHDTSRAEVQNQIRWIAAHPSYLMRVCRQSEPYIYHIVREIKKRNLPGELALIPIIESAYDPFAYSGVGAAGLWQLMPRTGSELGLKQDWWFDGRRGIRSSTEAALHYLAYLNKFFKGNWTLAIAAYDTGEGNISRKMKATGSSVFWDLPVARETQIYVPRLLALAEIIKNPKQYKINLPEIPYLPYFEEVDIGGQIDLNHAAKMAGISYQKLISLNPGYNRWTTAPYKPFNLLIPKEKVQQFNANLANFPQDKRVSWTQHEVRQGDSLTNIANRYHTTVNLIKQLNQLPSNQVKPQQKILIPSTANAPIVVKKEIAIAKTTPYENQLQSMKSKRVIHIVQHNEDYGSIQKNYAVSKKEIQGWNKLAPTQALQAGQQLIIWRQIRQPKSYLVKKDDTLLHIATKHHTGISQILALNAGLNPNEPLKIGEKIYIG